MRALIQRVTHAKVTVNEEVVGAIDHGLLIFLGVAKGDPPAAIETLADKVTGLRIFSDDDGKMNRSVMDVGGAALVVSQFTLLADCKKGRRPSYFDAEAPERAREMCDQFSEALRSRGLHVETGSFGAHMNVELINDGPVTIWLDHQDLGSE